MSVPRYQKYKNSGVAWLGDVPEHWDVKPFFAVAKERDEPNAGMIENNLLSLSYGRIIQKNIDDNDGLLPASFETYQIVHANDIVFRLTDLQNDQRSLRTAIVGEKGIITSAYLAAVPTKINPDYFNYLLRAYDKMKIFYSMGGGLRQSMKFSDIKWLPIVTPPEDTQKSIAAFLDCETMKIDALVAEQERLIELLKEKRQAVISRAVTKGLNPKAPMKPSGIYWLGDIPAHWEAIQRKRLAKIKNGKDYKEVEVDEGCFPVIGSGGEFARASDYLYSGESVLLGRKGTIDKPVYINGSFWTVDTMFYTTINKGVSAKYLFYCAKTIHFDLYSTSTALPSMTQEDLGGISFAVPPFDEQVLIAEHLDEVISRYENLIGEAQRAIDLLQERRTALISAAVTGKIDVRGVASTQNKEAA